MTPVSRPRPGRSAAARVRLALAVFAAAVLVALMASGMAVDVARLREGLARGAAFVAAFLRPDFASHGPDLVQGFLESVAIALVATAAGVVLAVPLALAAARNVAPKPLYAAARLLLAGSRALPEIVVAIFFVVAVGFGPLAGALTLALASTGFVAKLLAEAIESVDPRPREGIRATGAGAITAFGWGVAPQVLPRFFGLTLYRLDINFRESTVIGIVGAGGIGATLQAAFGRYEFGTAAAVLAIIFAVVLSGEWGARRLRDRWL